MMINRHNYEEFFLLYADDELNHQQRAAVELFVQQNPDMAAELEILQQMKLQPEEYIVFPDKSTLFKTTDVEINVHNYEEFFLLYIDKELDERASAKVEKFVLQHPQLQDEFTLLKQTVLQPEAITFTDKGSLYRREERKVGYIQFARLAAAAAVIGLVLLGWWLYPKTTTEEGGKTLASSSHASVIQTPQSVDSKGQAAIDLTKAQANPNKATASVEPSKKQDRVSVPAQALKNSIVVVKQQPVTPVKQGDNTNNTAALNLSGGKTPNTQVTTTPDPVVVATIDSHSDVFKKLIQPDKLADNTIVHVEPTDTGGVKPPVTQLVTASADTKPDVTAVAYRELNTDEDDHSMYVGSLALNKDKVKSFLKRAGRFFGAKPKKDID